jgi:hypothetical protein
MKKGEYDIIFIFSLPRQVVTAIASDVIEPSDTAEGALTRHEFD